jgi:hypothetical protein
VRFDVSTAGACRNYNLQVSIGGDIQGADTKQFRLR